VPIHCKESLSAYTNEPIKLSVLCCQQHLMPSSLCCIRKSTLTNQLHDLRLCGIWSPFVCFVWKFHWNLLILLTSCIKSRHVFVWKRILCYNYYCCYTHLMAFFRDNLAKLVPERWNHCGFLWGKRWWGFGMAVASTWPYANNLHLAPDR